MLYYMPPLEHIIALYAFRYQHVLYNQADSSTGVHFDFPPPALSGYDSCRTTALVTGGSSETGGSRSLLGYTDHIPMLSGGGVRSAESTS